MNINGPNSAINLYTGMRPIRPAATGSVQPTGGTPASEASREVGDVTQTVRLQDLVAGTVQSGINRGVGFDGPTNVDRADAMQLYTSDAERVEAATGVARGRILDTTG
ncbi:MAG: hypothetical protein CMJ53_06105 [Planctomycetaceae bacterium]|nr:hypothetical protein [Planctomycetaceae bacterium]